MGKGSRGGWGRKGDVGGEGKEGWVGKGREGGVGGEGKEVGNIQAQHNL